MTPMDMQKARSVLIIDDDPSWRKALKKYVNQNGIMTVETKEDGESGWLTLASHKRPKYDLIILDWNLPKINGLSLLNRIRKSDTYGETPVMIISGYLQDDDFRLFEEFPLTEGISKPISIQKLTKSLELLLRESAWFRLQRQEITRIFQTVDAGNSQTLFQFRQLVGRSPKPNALIIAAAKLLIYGERYLAAEELLSFFLEDTPDSLTGLNQLAKVYLHTRRYREAANTLEQASKISPKNLERLCLLGDAKLHSLQIDEAQMSFEKALNFDKQNIQARIGKDFAGLVEPKLARLSDDAIPRAYSSLLNSRGIVAARLGQFDDAIEQYRNAMVYTVDPLTKGRVAFNVGLAYVRWSKIEEAEAWLQRSVNYARNQFPKAAQKLAEVSTKARESGQSNRRDDIQIVPSSQKGKGSSGFERLPYVDEKASAPSTSIDEDIEEFERLEIPESIDLNDLLNATTKKAS